MQILTDVSQVSAEPSCLSVGYFDGVHLGHRYLVGQALACARQRGARAVLLTFYPHPDVVLRGKDHCYLSSRDEKLTLLSELDLDLIVIQPFTPGLAQTPAEQFVDWLIEHVGMVSLWVGPDFALGYHRQGDVSFLKRMGDKKGFEVHVVARQGGISSSRIRQLLRQGDVTLAARYLGRPYSLHGPVVIGAQRGRTLGFPTANIEVPAERIVPSNGVYATWAWLYADEPDDGALTGSLTRRSRPGERFQAVVNVGTRPTFDNGLRTVEAYLLDFDREIYGQRLTLDFVARLRPEERFEAVDALVAQMHRDVDLTRRILPLM